MDYTIKLGKVSCRFKYLGALTSVLVAIKTHNVCAGDVVEHHKRPLLLVVLSKGSCHFYKKLVLQSNSGNIFAKSLTCPFSPPTFPLSSLIHSFIHSTNIAEHLLMSNTVVGTGEAAEKKCHIKLMSELGRHNKLFGK